MALVSLLTPEGDSEMEYQRKRYGYGTEIYLNSEQCEALGLGRMSAGQSVMVRATGSKSDHLNPSSSERRSPVAISSVTGSTRSRLGWV